MNNNNILVTGAAGFIGFHLVDYLLKNNFHVLGIDNLNNYYNVKLKKNRIDILEKNENFSFHKIDITDKELLAKSFNKFKPNKVINLAAQAGVRYSIENPYAYMNSNLVGYLNIIELCRQNEVDGFIYASSSSVYGGNKKIPFATSDNTDDPISLYAATKKSNELIANAYSHLYNMHTTGLRFFTVYGPWGRPDMAMYLFADKIIRNEPIKVFNNGKMKRDFTYIDDIVKGIVLAMNKNYKCEVFNLGNNKSEELMNVVNLLEKYLDKNAKIEFLPIQPGDVVESFADIDKSKNMLLYEPTTNIEVGVKKFIDWHNSYTKVQGMT